MHLLLTRIRYYTLSTILGFVALTYGSVPLYKMVTHPPTQYPNFHILTHL